MKKVLYIILLLCLFPTIVFADYRIDNAVRLTNSYIYSLENYNKYLFVPAGVAVNDASGAPYYARIEAGMLKPIHRSSGECFNTGGMLNKDELLITEIMNKSYLEIGLEFFLSDGTRQNVLNYANDNKYSAIRVTEFVLHNATVSGSGTYDKPWVFQ